MKRVALVHDFLVEYGGAERVLEAFHDMYPDAHVYTSVVNEKGLGVHWERIKRWDIRQSWYGKTPLVRRFPSIFRFLAPFIWESFNLSDYDLVISSSGWFMCKGVLTRPETRHISYIHHQNKFLTYYETPDDWEHNWLKRLYGHIVGPGLRAYDFIGSQRPDILVANSQETQKRIQKYYRRDSYVLYPPIFDPHVRIEDKLAHTKDYFITVNRLTRPKHIDVLIRCANKAQRKLIIVGKGKELGALKKLAGPTVHFAGEVTDRERNELLMGARGFLFASVDEEFGMAPVEAMMYGVPVIAYASGGVKETVIHKKSGILIDSLSVQSFVSAFADFDTIPYEELCIGAQKQAQQFSARSFQTRFVELVNHAETAQHTRLPY